MHHTTARVNNRTLGRQQQARRLFNLPTVPAARWRVGPQLHLLRVVVLVLVMGVGEIFRQIHNNRPGATAGGDIKRLLDHLGDLFGFRHLEAVLHNRPRNTEHVGFLEGVLTDQVTHHLPGKYHHRNRIHIRRGNTGNGIGGSGAGCHQHHTGFTRGTGITVCRMGGRLLMAHQNMRHLTTFEKRIVNM